MHSRFGVIVGAFTLVAGMVTAPVSASAGRPGDLPTARPVMGFQALNNFNSWQMNGGSTEPPQQGLCAGNGFVLESVSGAIVVYDSHGNMVEGPDTLNDFFGYDPAMTPPTPTTPPAFGPQVTDPTCYFDGDTQRWFQVVLTLETDKSSGALTGVNHIDIAVSPTADPTVAWHAWSINKLYPKQVCAHVCLGDFPHIGANADGFFVTTNVYDLADETFYSAHVYAFSKHELETDAAHAQPQDIDTAGMVGGSQAGFTVWPAQAPSGVSEHHGEGDLDTSRGGTEFFLSSNAADEVNAGHSQTSRDLILWSLSNTQSLGSDHPDLTLTNSVLTVGRYSVPPAAQQKEADPALKLTPLADCLNDTTLPVGPKFGCWRRLLRTEPSHNWAEGQSIDTADTRMQQVMFAGGLVYGALGTAVDAGGEHLAGIEWFAVRPHVTAGGDVHAQVVNQGYLSRPDTALSFPAMAVNSDGVGVIGFSLMGPNDYPSAAYAPFDVKVGTGEVTIAAPGVGPDDGASNYATAFNPHAPARTRWGDYGAAVVDGSRFWIASEYIAQACTFDQWLVNTPASPFGTCGRTRAGGANWATRITGLTIPG